MRVLSIALLSLMTGCSLLQPQPIVQPEPIIKTVTKVVPLEIYQPPLPTEITLSEVDFFVITENNLEEQIERLEKLQGGSFVIFAMTPQTYENMAYNLQEIRRYIGQQKEIIIYYREATQDEDDNTTSEDWIERNSQKIEIQQSQD
jgi:hypothetical protein